MTFVEVFQLDGTDTSVRLQHQLVWSLITISGSLADSSRSVLLLLLLLLLLLSSSLLSLYHNK